jgi:hypothetical protein
LPVQVQGLVVVGGLVGAVGPGDRPERVLVDAGAGGGLLRHGLASLMARERYSASDIAAHLGHADGGVLALRTYIHSDGLESTDFIDCGFGVDPAVDPDPSVGPSVDPEPADIPNP